MRKTARKKSFSLRANVINYDLYPCFHDKNPKMHFNILYKSYKMHFRI
jgi:hypothetical protein